jgi:hypothetical protein
LEINILIIKNINKIIILIRQLILIIFLISFFYSSNNYAEQISIEQINFNFEKQQKDILQLDQQLFDELLSKNKNPELILKLIKQHKEKLSYKNLRFTKDKEIILKSLEINGFNYQYLNDEAKTDPENILLAIKTNPQVYKLFPNSVKENEDLIYLILDTCNIYMDIPEKLKSNIKIVKYAYIHYPEIFNYLPKDLYKNRELMLFMLDEYINTFKTNLNLNIVYEKYKNVNFSEVDTSLLSDEEIAQRLIKIDPNYYKIIPDQLKNDKNFILKLIKDRPQFIQYVDYKLGSDVNFRREREKIVNRISKELILSPRISILNFENKKNYQLSFTDTTKTRINEIQPKITLSGLIDPETGISYKMISSILCVLRFNSFDIGDCLDIIGYGLPALLGNLGYKYDFTETTSFYLGYNIDYINKWYFLINLGVNLYDYNMYINYDVTTQKYGYELGLEFYL